jgi:uncharacterized membrane protein
MIPDPLHPAVVHFPIVLAVLMPLLAAAGFLAIRSGRLPARSWIGVLGLQALLVGAAFAATETGEREEERAERAVAERYIEEHEAQAERFLVLAALGLPLAAAGLLAGRAGAINRGLTVGLSLAALAAAGSTGHSGGELVYRHGAASVYAQSDQADQAASKLPLAYAEQDDDEDTD